LRSRSSVSHGLTGAGALLLLSLAACRADDRFDAAHAPASVRGTLRISLLAEGEASRVTPGHVSVYRNEIGYAGMADVDLRGFLDGRFRYGWNQPSQIHVRTGRFHSSPRWGEVELFRSIYRWGDLDLPRDARVDKARVWIQVEEAPRYTGHATVFLYALNQAFDPGEGGTLRNNTSPPKKGEVWWGERAHEIAIEACSMDVTDLRKNAKIEMDGQPWVVTDFQFVKPGKGQAFNRVRVRNLKTARVMEKTFRSGESVEAADVHDTQMQYLYNDGDMWHFMDPESYEQLSADATAMGEAVKWIKEEDTCGVTLWNGTPLSIEPPNFVVLRITDTDPGLKGDTSGGGGKPATLETGAVVRVPLFVQTDELIKVDTRSGEYVSRAKDA